MSLAGDTFASLSVPRYRRYFTGHVASLLGFWLRVVVQGWLVYRLTGSRTMLGAVTAVGLAPFVVLSPWGGVVADRLDRRRLLFWLPLVAVLSNAAIGILVLADRIAIGHVFVTALLVGAARAVEIPVRNAFVRDLVGREHLGNAIALNSAGFNMARVAGPALGAPLLWALDMGWCFVIAAVLNLAMMVALAGVRTASEVPLAARGGPWRQLLEGLVYVRGHRRTRTLLTLLAITLVSTWAYQTLMPAFARDRLGLEEEGYALLMASPGLGALVGALWVAGRTQRRRATRHVVFGLVWAGAACVCLLGLVRHVALAVPLLALVGFCQVAFIATGNTLVQESVPDELRGRVMGIWTFVFGSAFPLGSLLMGQVAQSLSLTAAWSGGAAVTVLLSGLVWLRLPPRTASLPGPPAPAPAPGVSDPAG